MDDSDPSWKEKIASHLYNIDQSVDIRLHPRRAGLGSHCQLDVHLSSRDSHVCRVV
jgi:hypothetical protein